jgi:hypothetical protein
MFKSYCPPKFPLPSNGMRYVQVSKKGNYGSFHNLQEQVNSKKSMFQNVGGYRNFGNFRNYGNFTNWQLWKF